ncbi:hypothetical protein [Endozoicomonas ascidiicola]|uniref:hypothetical protein n=1 Tax=Endozoicomonas ascidiicola TaxID=1698521 RepID=UPI00082DF6C1|nr:hypothetical protein [Endozoicomonas ascidiicola]
MAQFTDLYLNFFGGKRTPRGQSILWPVWVWEVLAPKPGQQELNLFQKSILGLIKASKRDPEQIAAWLGLDKELILYIIAGQLIPNGWICKDWELTELGLQMLEEDEEQRGNLSTAYIFQDAITGKLWPRVSKSLSYISPLSEDGRPEFKASRASDWIEKPFIIHCSSRTPEPPSVLDIRSALRQGNNAIHNMRVRGELEYHKKEFRADEIELLKQSPSPAYVMCWIVEDRGDIWNVSDPLAVTPTGDFFRQDIYVQAQNNSGLRNRLSSIIGELPKKETYEEMIKRQNASVELAKFTEYSNADRVPNLESALGALLRRQQALEDAQSDKSIRYEDCDDLVTQAQKVFEACFKWMLSEWPIANRRFIDKKWGFEDIRCALEGVAGPFLTDEDLDDLAKQKSGSIFWAATQTDPNVSLRPLVAATLFTLTANPTHPLLSFGIKDLAISSILGIARDRNAVAHASDKQTNKETALECARFSCSWVKTLLKNLD